METVLVVESEAITRYSWTEALAKRGYGVLEARDCTEALTLLRTQSGVVSALVVEDLLSSERAMKLACEMKQVNPKLCVVTCCTFCSDDQPSYVPYDAALEKPVNANQVIAVLQKLLRDDSPKEPCLN
jgi:CheY-like chemotaxis protein